MSSPARPRGPTRWLNEGLTPIVADVLAARNPRGLPTADTVLYAVGYDRTADQSMREVYVEGLANVLAALPAGTGRILYVSSTGVYGQTDGERSTNPARAIRRGKGAGPASKPNSCSRPIRLGRRAVTFGWPGFMAPAEFPADSNLCGPAAGGAGRRLA